MLAPLVCGFQTGAATMLQVLAPELGHTVAIFGAGGVGLSALMAAMLTPANRVIVVDVVPERLALAKELGATHTVNAATDDSVEAINEITSGRGPDRIIEASGNTAVLKQALTSMATDSIVAIVGAPPFGSEVAVDVLDAIVKGPRIIGVNQGRSVPRVVIPALVDHFLSGRMPFDKLIRTYPVADINDAIHDMHSGATIKPVLLMPDAA
jgi:aryl-alcohol dehydrogenase